MFRRVLPVLAATLLVACGGTGDDATGDGGDAAPVEVATAPTPAPTPDATTAVEAAGDGPVEVPAALQLTAPLVGGGEIELGAYAGRPVLLWFWAPW